MAFDGITTKAIICELNNSIINGKINKIFEPNKNEILFGIYSMGKNFSLNISIDSNNYRISLTTHTKPNPKNVLNFCMVLRKHLIGSTIRKIYSNGFERVIFIDLDCYNELNDLITKTLVIELMGKHSNIILLNSNKVVIDSLRHLDKFDSSLRDIFPGSTYEAVPCTKFDFYNIKTFDEFYKIINSNLQDFKSLSTILQNSFNGFSKKNTLKILSFLNINDDNSSTEDLKKIYNYLKDFSSVLKNNSTNGLNIQSFETTNSKKDYFTYFDSSIENSNLNINFFIDDFYYNKEICELFKLYRDNLLKLILDYVKRLNDKLSTIKNKIDECSKMDLYKLYGELITSNLYRIQDFNQDSIKLENYYDNNNLIAIPLDKTISPSHNAKQYFKKYKKLQNTISVVNKHKELIEKELAYIDSILYEINTANSIEDINSIYAEIEENLSLNSNSSNSVSLNLLNVNTPKKTNLVKSSSIPSEYLIDGYSVLVGKNNKQNDYLTCKLAKNTDIWFHTKDIHGSHVVLRMDNFHDGISKLNISKVKVPDSVLYKCAAIAAYYSKARLSQNVPVDFTYIKYVKKPNGAKPGMVIYTNNKTLYVNPQKPL